MSRSRSLAVRTLTIALIAVSPALAQPGAPAARTLRGAVEQAPLAGFDESVAKAVQDWWDATWRGTTLATFVLDATGEPLRLQVMGASFARRASAASQ